jgi:hypothetical protein
MNKRDMESLFLALTIGFPFCIFKVLCGRVAFDSGHSIIGGLLCLWGAVDFLFNLVRLIQGFMGVKRKIQFCLLAVIGGIFNHAPLFLAIDTLLAFSIICLVLWTGWIQKLTSLELKFWLAATTINLLSVGVVQIGFAFKNREDREMSSTG